MKKSTSSAGARGSAKAGGSKPAKKSSTKQPASKPDAKAEKKSAAGEAKLSLQQRIAEGKKLEALDSKPAKTGKQPKSATASHPQRNSDFPNTYIEQISVSLDDPDHWMTLTWTGPEAASQETGPFRTSPGAGVTGLNCDDTATSRRSGSNCTPKGTFTVEGFQHALNSDSRAVYVTWFVRRRGIACHYFPSVPRYAASHGCVRIEQKRVAQLVQSNSRIDLTQIVVSGTWTKPARQH